MIGTVSMRSARRVGGRDPMRPVRDALIPLNQTTVLDPDETLDDAFEWLSGQDGLVLEDGGLVGALGRARRRGVVPPGDRGTIDADRVRGAAAATGRLAVLDQRAVVSAQ